MNLKITTLSLAFCLLVFSCSNDNLEGSSTSLQEISSKSSKLSSKDIREKSSVELAKLFKQEKNKNSTYAREIYNQLQGRGINAFNYLDKLKASEASEDIREKSSLELAKLFKQEKNKNSTFAREIYNQLQGRGINAFNYLDKLKASEASEDIREKSSLELVKLFKLQKNRNSTFARDIYYQLQGRGINAFNYLDKLKASEASEDIREKSSLELVKLFKLQKNRNSTFARDIYYQLQGRGINAFSYKTYQKPKNSLDNLTTTEVAKLYNETLDKNSDLAVKYLKELTNRGTNENYVYKKTSDSLDNLTTTEVAKLYNETSDKNSDLAVKYLKELTNRGTNENYVYKKTSDSLDNLTTTEVAKLYNETSNKNSDLAVKYLKELINRGTDENYVYKKPSDSLDNLTTTEVAKLYNETSDKNSDLAVKYLKELINRGTDENYIYKK